MLPQEERVEAFLRTAINDDWMYDIFAHSFRMVGPAQAIAWELGLTQERVKRVGLAALLHDLGKLVLPGAMLEKPGPLSTDEWELMRSHPGIGCRILQRLGSRWESLALIVAAHHERWDGRGYPNGLAREEIPLEARILAVVDAYDAMTSARVYRSPLSVEQARGELKRCSGQQFDPLVVETFLLILAGWREQLEEKQKYLPALDGGYHQSSALPRREYGTANKRLYLNRRIALQGV